MTGCENEDGELTKRLEPHLTEDRSKENEQKEADDETKTEEDENEGVPVDKGYAWMITLSKCLPTVIFGFTRSLSVLLIPITEEFNSRLTVVTICFTILTLSGSIASLVASNMFMSRYSVRTLSLAGAVFGPTAIALMAVSPNIAVFLATFVLKGSSFGLLLLCPNSLIGYYFRHRRGLATSLCNTGFCVSYIVYPVLAEALSSEYGLRGCLIILAALELNLIACAMLLVPPALFKKHYHARKKRLARQNGHVSPSDEESTMKENGKYDAVEPDSKAIFLREANGDEKVKLVSNGVNTGSAELGDVTLSCSPKSITSLSPPGSPTQPSLLSVNGAKICNGTIKTSDGTKLSDGAKNLSANTVTYQRQLSIYASQQSLAVDSVPYFPPDVDDDNDSEDSKNNSQKKKKNWRYYLNKAFDTSVFKIYCFRMFLLFSPLATFNVYLLIYMPFIATMSGLTQADGAFLMTISGFMDLLARLVLSCMADFKWFSKTRVVALSMVVLSVICHGSRVINSYHLFVTFAVVVGMFVGVRQTLASVIMLEIVGTEKFAKGFGFLATLCTLALAINHPIVGALLDTTGSFVIPLHYVGSVLMIAAIIILTEPIWKRKDARRKKEEMALEEMNKSTTERELVETV
ncbi:monocarboxylate transporter [Plakobranchus ocellatus]|uniref:Monocarboxylate transporter n=1 Tax=Plakobranchus ocellatus TaxID=259542 RepID=A0AAV3ZFF4_9GAST|nr:monocarboxylate transporter [Plakobranchus ocellatus]